MSAAATTLAVAFAAAFAALGVVAVAAGRVFGDIGPTWDHAFLIVSLTMGAQLALWLDLPIPDAIGGASSRWLRLRPAREGPGGDLDRGPRASRAGTSGDEAPTSRPDLASRSSRRGISGACLLGAISGLVSIPCATPILVVVMAHVASSGASFVYGVILLLADALGHSVLILLVGSSAGRARRLVASPRLAGPGRAQRIVAGVAIATVGISVFLVRD